MKNQNVTLKNATILVTGAAGFIGSNLVLELLRTTEPVHIIGIDNMNDYYDVSIIIFHPQGSASSLYTDLPEDQIWHTLDLQTNYVPEKQFRSLIMETANETLPLSMIL